MSKDHQNQQKSSFSKLYNYCCFFYIQKNTQKICLYKQILKINIIYNNFNFND